MKFPRNTKVFRGQMDAAPFASVLFVFIILLLVQSSLVFTPGISVRLPETVDLPGTMNPKVVVTVDDTGQIYYENQVSDDRALKDKLSAAREGKEALTLVIQADRGTKYDVLVRLAMLAREAGINEVLLATRARLAPVPLAENGGR
jgi:biopolymer transport protein ExbD